MAEWALVIGAGPSLCRDDLKLLRGRCRAIAVNCAVFFAPWADVLYAGDSNWWQYYGPKINWFKGARVTRAMNRRGLTVWRGKGWKRTGGNSGHQALQYAVDLGNKHVALIGFDHQKTEGKAHCHQDHPERALTKMNLGNADGVRHWPQAMNKTAKDLEAMGIEMVNLSRVTALTCFKRMTVEEFLEEKCPFHL